MELLSWLATRVFTLPWPCLLTLGPSYLPGVNAQGRENKPPLMAPNTIGCLLGWQWMVAARTRTVAGWLSAGTPTSCSPRLYGAALLLGWTRHVADLRLEDNRGAIYSLWQKPTHSHWVKSLLGHKEIHQGGPCSTVGILGPQAGTVPFSSGACMV